MAIRPAVRVGILVFLAFVAFVLVFLFLRGYALLANRYIVVVTFDNALGLIEGAEVRMAGVPIGRVASVTLDENQRARAVLDINRKYRIPKGSKFIIQTGLLISQQFVEVFPNRKGKEYIRDGAKLEGEMPVRVEELLPRAVVILDNLAESTAHLRNLVGDEYFQHDVRQSARNIEELTAKLDKTVGLIQGNMIRSRDDFDAIVSNLRLASSNVRNMTADLESFVSDSELQGNMRETLVAARRSAETLEEVAASVERSATSIEALVTAPEFQKDIRETVSDARQTVEAARDAVERVNKLLGGGGGPKFKIPTRDTNLDVLYVPDDDRLRVDLATSVPLSDSGFLSLGLYDLGVSNKLILQAGKPLGSRTDLRYGLYASRLGVGLDYNFSPRSFGRLDLYDTENTKLNMRAGYRFSESLGMLIGVDDLLGENKATIGLQFAR